ncbi:MAG: Ig-like domain-containing protein, partial [Lachnospiraceae bacterium]|nr:Ig-like domain-containing protein [Lachnospiraceae bacterium]
GETKTITYTIKPSNSTDSIKWSSSDEDIASVSSSGKITAKKIGVSTVTIMTTSGKTATVTVHVLGLSRTYLEIPIYTQYSQLVLDGADPADVRWDVTDITVCDVQNGVIIARKLGSTSVTATYNGRTLKATIKVVPK